MDVLKKILKAGLETELAKKKEEAGGYLETFQSEQKKKKLKRLPGRPRIEDKKKAKNITFCLPSKYLRFLDEMKIKNAPGRSRKIKFIIDEFLDLKKRERKQIETFTEALKNLKSYLDSLDQDSISKKLVLQPKEKKQIKSLVEQVFILARLLGFKREELEKKLPKSDYLIVMFCLDWKRNQKWS